MRENEKGRWKTKKRRSKRRRRRRRSKRKETPLSSKPSPGCAGEGGSMALVSGEPAVAAGREEVGVAAP